MSLRILFIFNFIANVYQVDLNVLLALFSIGPQFSYVSHAINTIIVIFTRVKCGEGHKERAILKEFII